MAELTSTSKTSYNLRDFVSTALQQTELSGLSNILKCIAEVVNAYTCILWVAPEELKMLQDPSSQYLFVLAQWIPDKKISVIHKLPLHNSATGTSVLTQQIINIPDIYAEDSGVHRNQDSRFFSETGIRAMCSIPLTLRLGVQGALNIYRQFTGKLDEEELSQINQMLSLFPDLYQSISDKVSLNVIGRVNEFLHRAELLAPDEPLPKKQVKKVLHKICGFLTESFQCFETSIFLEDRLESPGSYEVMATTWPEKPFKKPVYRKDLNDGLTGWVLDNAKSVKIFDLAYFEQTQKVLGRIYKGITWGDPLHIKSVVRNFLVPEFQQDESPPLSFIAAPIVKGKYVRGVIRCCVTKKNPYYFTDAELKVLELVAAQISRFWSNWLYRHEMQAENMKRGAENESWRALVYSVIKLNRFVHNELKNEPPDERRIFKQALALISSVISGAEIMDVRLLDESKSHLSFYSTYGKAWNEGEVKQIQDRMRRTFPIDDPKQMSAGAKVFLSGEPLHLTDVTKDPIYSATFPNIKHMLIVPISVENEKYGVLDIRRTEEEDFPNYAIDIALLLGQQLGLYLYLAKLVGELKRVQKREIQTYQDLEHQLSHPIILAHARVQAVLRKVAMDEESQGSSLGAKLQASLWKVRGLCGKAMRVTLSTWLFINLSQKKPIHPTLKRLDHDELIKMLIEAAADNELLIDPDRHIRFDVDRKTFEVLKSLDIRVDYSLLEQCLGNLLDNAGKYSYDDTVVRLYGGLTSTKRFHISVSNKGIPIRSYEVAHCAEREWRSEQAKWVVSDGSGIGLWIVDHIMKAHDGDLIITPTNDKITDFKLVFPQAKNEARAR